MSTSFKQTTINCWDAVMDSRHNPLRDLSLEVQHYFMQVLGWMWSMVFSLSFLTIFQFGYVWVAHVLVFAGIVFTVAVFKEAEQARTQVPVKCVWDLEREA